MIRNHSAFLAQTGRVARGAALAELDASYMEDARHCLALLDMGGPIDAPASTNGGPTLVTLQTSLLGTPYSVRTFTHGVPRE